MPPPAVTIITVNYNGEKYLRKCFPSIANQDFPKEKLQIILVDNASKDGSVDYIKKAYPKVKVVQSGYNAGYSGGANIGYAHAKGKYVALMANDMFFPKNWIKSMANSLEKNANAAAATATMVNIGEKKQEGELLNATPLLVGRGDTARTGYTVVPWGGACMFKKELFKLPFDSDYFIYGEDTYLGLMSWLRGYKLVENKIKVSHYGTITIGFFSKLQVHYNERNRLINMLSFFKLKTVFLLMPLFISDIIIKLAYFLKIKRPDLVDAELKAVWWNVKNLGKVFSKRRAVQKQRNVGDHVILGVLCENIYGEGRLKSILNAPAIGYFRMIKRLWRFFGI